jgi:hypothetical protein
MAAIAGGLLGALTRAGDILSQAFETAKEVGRVTFDVGVRIFDFFSDPKKGILFSIAVVKLTDLINIDVQQVTEFIDNIASNIEKIDWDQIIPPVTIDIEALVDEAKSVLPVVDCGSPPNPVLDPAGAFNWAGCNIANGFKIIGQGIYFFGRVLELGLLFILRELAVLIARGVTALAALFLRNVIKPIVFAIASALSFLRDKIRWACCEYLKFSHFLVMARLGYDIFSKPNRNIIRGLVTTFTGTIVTMIAVAALTPECAPQAPPTAAPPTSPIVIGFPSASLLSRTYELSFNSAIVMMVSRTIIAVDYVRSAEGSGLV